MTPEKALTVTTRATEAYATAGADWTDAVHHTVRNLIDRLAAARGLTPPCLERPACPTADTVLDELGPMDGWHVFDLGEVHQRVLELTAVRGKDGTVVADRRDLGRRATQGAWYTPPEVADAMVRLSIGQQLDRFEKDPDPAAVLNVLAIDPACGAGVFLIAAARFLAQRLAARVAGVDPAPAAHLPHALPLVMRECVFGVDIDPVAVDLSKTALWLEVDGRQPFDFMDRNVIRGDALNGDEPPAYTERSGLPIQSHDAPMAA